MGFWIGKRSLVKPAFIGEICNSDEKVVEKEFSNKRVLGKKTLWDKGLVFNFLFLFFQKSQLGSRLNHQCQ